jgi:hypothetical protein
MRAAIAGTAVLLTGSIAMADDVQDAHRQALAGRDSYWNCLAAEYQQVGSKNVSAPDFAALIGGACASERQNFRVMLMDYLAQQFPDVDAGTHLATANNAIALAQKDIVTTYTKKRAEQK